LPDAEKLLGKAIIRYENIRSVIAIHILMWIVMTHPESE